MRRIDELHLNYPFAGSRMLESHVRITHNDSMSTLEMISKKTSIAPADLTPFFVQFGV